MIHDLSLALANIGVSYPAIPVNDLRLDSRDVCPGDCFIALRGHQQDGGQYVGAALKRGAVVVLADTHCTLDVEDERVLRISALADKVALLAATFYGEPSRALKLIGVTGTNGKSTTTAMIAHLASACGLPGAVIGTLGYGAPDALTPLHNTTPSHVDLQRILNELRHSYQLAAMEVSSHGLVQGRVAQCQFDVAVFTNLSRDHLDYHGTMENYAEAKLQLFSNCQPNYGVLNIDDPWAQAWLKAGKIAHPIGFGRKPADGLLHEALQHFVYFSEAKFDSQGIHFRVHTSWGDAEVSTPLFGEFNLYNLSAAFAVLLVQGVPLAQLVEGAVQLQPVTGRMQAIEVAGQPTCVVDYAHTPDALALALQALQQHVPGKVTCVFGCGGERDKGKRALMAQAAEQYADTVVITSDNPRGEDPLTIIEDIKAGLSKPEYALCQPDRASAIRDAIRGADQHSVILIAGKGHEDYQIIGNQRLAFSDISWAQKILTGESA
ncbi:UDP-N-acetylmuramoyl-L-alanyl-D-glutamate--2,6-diaminopimelate ligase [Pseudoalteromonas rubra]|uniref:UDP-N-acetylmuramoyl-L-alanyl-D-glutamate--2,6-diaminopimelate ligase n=1 Tax=Pseudoalteromonas rubra TaxID=43658 RepID=A0A5S3WTH2_9GAMM|nr:UDP-N-acetylmuramoyl-L-alanyl-D-glutamate--2,6-diaminopimelate ligase [Pseudoalteromonas rubra]TMP31491.1 UDP-N-acetylmuramoyl-L-alanyl-D-glutamate--2,6-diaminopimelate ligase [Pseudoalteromonas rubra]TMP34575.1 UDP-N-acetylmuramoyl-L-alanyl-D-glutamate--2,6-diaminopimelate ligase [Pseudoalteromonas rubra]